METSSGKSTGDIANSLDLRKKKSNFKIALRKHNIFKHRELSESLHVHSVKRFPFRCPHCTFKTSWRSNFEHHLELHEGPLPFRCHKCGFGTTELTELVRHKRKHDMGYWCSLCTAVFKLKHRLEEHIRQHTGEKPFACPDCHRPFRNESSVIRHQERNCCPKNFRSFNTYSEIPSGLAKVRKNIYGQAKNLVNFRSSGSEVTGKADVAGQLKSPGRPLELRPRANLVELAPVKQNNTKLTYQLISKECSNNKRFPCTMCSATFSRFDKLDQHIRKHTGERPFSCTQCNYSTAYRNCMTLHYQKNHPACKNVRRKKKNNYLCEFCDEDYSTAFELLDHLREHTGQILHKCQQSGCDFKTVDKKIFAIHRGLHG